MNGGIALARPAARGLVALSLAVRLSAPATTIPPDLEARAADLQRRASPAVQAWVREEGAVLAKASGPVDIAAVKQKIRARFGAPARAVRGGGPASAATWSVLGDLNGGDIEALCFLVLMAASKSAQEDLKAIMAHVKAINSRKASPQGNVEGTGKTAAISVTRAPSPTPGPDRVSILLAAARSASARPMAANLSHVATRR